jgi:hypothetical protein
MSLGSCLEGVPGSPDGAAEPRVIYMHDSTLEHLTRRMWFSCESEAILMQVKSNRYQSRQTAALLFEVVAPLPTTSSMPTSTSEATPLKTFVDYGALPAEEWIHVVMTLVVRSRQQLTLPACRWEALFELLLDEYYTSIHVIAVEFVTVVPLLGS